MKPIPIYDASSHELFTPGPTRYVSRNFDPREQAVTVSEPVPVPPPALVRLSVSEVLDRLLIDRGAAMVAEVEQWMERWK